MPSKKYPLEPLASVRAARTDDAKRELASAIAQRTTAEKRLAAAEAERAQAEARARALRDAEQRALERGELSVHDLMRADAWEARVREDKAQLERQVTQATTRDAEARTIEAGVRGELAHRSAEAEVVQKDRDRWLRGERKKDEAKEEEAGVEAWRPKGER